MKTKSFFLVLAGFLSVLLNSVVAENYLLEITEDKKVIHTDKLGLPLNTTAQEILQILPELLSREGDFIMDDYDLQVEGVSIGNARDAILSQTFLADIEAIEVSESPISSYHNNGQGGAIDIKLKTVKDGFSGNVTLDLHYRPDVNPSVQMNYKNDKLMIHGMMTMESFAPNDITTKTKSPSGFLKESRDERFLCEMARIYVNFTPNTNNNFKFRIHENLSSLKKKETATSETVTKKDYYNNVSDFLAKMEYEHLFGNRSKMKVEACYDFAPLKDGLEYDGRDLDNTKDEHRASGKLEYTFPLIASSSPNKADFTFGSNVNYVVSDASSDEFFINTENWHHVGLDTEANSIHVSPYFQTQCLFGKFSLKTILEYQYYRYKVETDVKEDFSCPRHDVTGKIMMGWQVKDNQYLRLMLDRKLERPTDVQVYPHYLYNSGMKSVVRGVADLDPMLSHAATIDYISDYNFNDNILTFNAAVGYIRTDGIIKSKTAEGLLEGFPKFEYLTFENSGKSDIVKGSLMLFYRRNIFSISATANIFNNRTEDETVDHYTYYNLSLLPALSFTNGWTTSLNFTYNSAVDMKNSSLGDCAFTELRIGKTWGKWEAHAYGLLVFSGHTQDKYYAPEGTTTISHYLMNSGAGVGFRYNF